MESVKKELIVFKDNGFPDVRIVSALAAEQVIN
jgi:hypothetical protein